MNRYTAKEIAPIIKQFILDQQYRPCFDNFELRINNRLRAISNMITPEEIEILLDPEFKNS